MRANTEIPRALLYSIICLLNEIADVHDVDEYGRHFIDCSACRAMALIKDINEDINYE